jgi:hypothetical protein
MPAEDELLERGQVGAAGFQEEQDLGALFEFSLPPIVGFEPGHQIGAGHEFGFEGGPGELPRRREVRGGDKHEREGGGGFHDSGLVDLLAGPSLGLEQA